MTPHEMASLLRQVADDPLNERPGFLAAVMLEAAGMLDELPTEPAPDAGPGHRRDNRGRLVYSAAWLDDPS